MDKFNIFDSLNCCNFVLDSKHFVRSGMDTMDSIMAFEGHSSFKCVHSSRFLRQSKDKVFYKKISINLSKGAVDFVKHIQIE